MEVLERSLDEERCLCGRMREEKAKLCVKTYPGVAHSRSNIGTGCAIVLEVEGWFGTVWHDRATLGTGRARFLDV